VAHTSSSYWLWATWSWFNNKSKRLQRLFSALASLPSARDHSRALWSVCMQSQFTPSAVLSFSCLYKTMHVPVYFLRWWISLCRGRDAWFGRLKFSFSQPDPLLSLLYVQNNYFNLQSWYCILSVLTKLADWTSALPSARDHSRALESEFSGRASVPVILHFSNIFITPCSHAPVYTAYLAYLWICAICVEWNKIFFKHPTNI
jgi:hypothetical protein